MLTDICAAGTFMFSLKMSKFSWLGEILYSVKTLRGILKYKSLFLHVSQFETKFSDFICIFIDLAENSHYHIMHKEKQRTAQTLHTLQGIWYQENSFFQHQQTVCLTDKL